MRNKFLSVFLMIALMVTFMPSHAFAAYEGESVTFEVATDKNTVQQNSEFTLTVKLKTGITKLGAFKAKMDYDESKLQVVKVENKLAGGSTEDTEDIGNKYIVFTWDTNSEGTDINANTDVFTVTFRVLTSEVGKNLAPKLTMAEDELSDATEDQNNIPFSINQATVSIPKLTAIANNYDINLPTGEKYDGSAKQVTITPKDSTGAGTVTHVYYKGSETAKTETPPTDAGTYEVTFDVLEGSNYQAANGLSAGRFTIARADAPTITVAESKTIVKGQTEALDATIAPSTLESELKYKSADTSKVNVEDNGTIKALETTDTPVNVTVSFAGNKNYNPAESKVVAVTVTKKTPVDVTFTSADAVDYQPNTTYKLGEKFNEAKTTVTGGTIKYVYNETTYENLDALKNVTVENAGAYVVKAVYESATEYGEKTATFTINKIDQAALTVTTDESVTYGSTLKLASDGGSGDGAVTYAVVDGGTGDATIDATTLTLTPTKAGTVKVQATKAASTNYNEAKSAEKEITISPKTVTITGITAATKVYDGTATATPTGEGVIEGLVAGDDVTIVAGTAAFDNKNVGVGKTVKFSGYALDGAGKKNYALSAQPADVTADITAKAVTITGITAENKTYDGNTNATPNGGTIDGMIDGDRVTIVAGTAAFNNKNVGDDKTVTFSGYNLGGTDAGNYTLSAQPAEVTANITAKEVTITGLTAKNKPFDGNTGAEVVGAAVIDGLVPSEVVTVTPGIAKFVDPNAGTGKTVKFMGYGITGDDVANYVLKAQPADVKANITPADQTITISTADKFIAKSGSVNVAQWASSNAQGAVLKFTMDSVAGVTLGETGTLTIDETVVAGTKLTIKVNSESINLNDESTPEYNEATEASMEVTVADKEKADVTIQGLPTEVTYADTFTLKASVANADSNGQWSWTFDAAAFKAVGSADKDTITLKAIAAGASAKNITAKYESDKSLGIATEAVTVAKRAITVNAKPQTWTVNQKPESPAFEVVYGNLPEGVTADDIFAIKTVASVHPSIDGKTPGTFDIMVTTPVLKAEAEGNYKVGTIQGAALTVKAASGGSSGGSSSVVTTPGKAAKDFVKNSMSANGSTIKNVSKDNYKQVLEAADKYNKLSAAEKEAVDKEMKAQTGKTMAELIAEAEAIKAAEDGSAATFDVQKAVKELTLKARSSKLKSGNVKIVLNGDLSEIEKNGYTVKYKFYRSTKKAKGYKAAVTKDAPNYLNTAGKKGKMYYYKAKVMVYDKDGNLVAKTELKQCKYANRTWMKK